MSYEIGMQAMKLQSPDRLAHTEYCDHYPLVRKISGGLEPTTDWHAWKNFYKAWQIDFLWSTFDGPLDFAKRGRSTDMGHAEFMENGSDWRDTVICPFKTAEEVLNFDAVDEYGLINMDELVKWYEGVIQLNRQRFPDQVSTGGYYNTIVSAAIQIFGWEMFLEAASDRVRFDKVFEGIFQQTLHNVKAQCQTSCDIFIQHDDMVWSSGAFMSPAFYRKSIFPRYKKLWKELHDAGKTVLFCSDGDFTQFIDDIAEAGADGFIFEPMTNLDYVVEKYAKTKVIIGSKVDCRTLTFGTHEDIKHEIDETLKIAKGCPGFVWAIGNHMPVNIPIDNAEYYFDYLSKNWNR
jgi:hypothetical protein